jgi:16S rRNA processing protein RimM
VRGSFWNGAQDVIRVVHDDGSELLLPAVPEYIRDVDLDEARIVVDPHE